MERLSDFLDIDESVETGGPLLGVLGMTPIPYRDELRAGGVKVFSDLPPDPFVQFFKHPLPMLLSPTCVSFNTSIGFNSSQLLKYLC